jgi:hypothetical protein
MPIKTYLSSDSLSYIGYIFIRRGGTICHESTNTIHHHSVHLHADHYELKQ